MRLVLVLFLAFWPMAALAEGVPKSVVAKVNRDAERYVDEVSVLIEGFGIAGAIDRQGLENVVSLARAEARALAFRRVQGADLDGDGIIAGPEVAVAAAAASAVARGRLLVNFAQADGTATGRSYPASCMPMPMRWRWMPSAPTRLRRCWQCWPLTAMATEG